MNPPRGSAARHRPGALTLALAGVLVFGSTAPHAMAAESPAPTTASTASTSPPTWHLKTTGNTVWARFASKLGGNEMAVRLDNRTGFTVSDPVAQLILKAVGLDAGYSQWMTWQGGSGPAIHCPTVGITYFCATDAAGGHGLLAESVSATLLATAPGGTGATLVKVAPSAASVTWDVALAAVGIAVETLVGAPFAAPVNVVIPLVVQLYPMAARLGEAIGRHDGVAAQSELNALSQTAASIIVEHLAGWGLTHLATTLTLSLVTSPAWQVKLGIAVLKVLPSLANLAVAVATGRQSTVAIAYGSAADAGLPGATTGSGWAGGAWDATWADGLGDWVGPPDWKTVSGMLVNDGTGGGGAGGSWIAAPYQPPGPDYAVEAEIQVLRYATENQLSQYGSFGLVVRGDDLGHYAVGSCQKVFMLPYNCGSDDRGLGIFVENAPVGAVADPAVVAGGGWHTYRVEVEGNSISLYVDGNRLVHEMSNRFLTGTQIGLWSSGVELNVQAFRVVSP